MEKICRERLKKIQKEYVDSIIFKIQNLSNNPFPNDVRKLKGSESFFRIRVGNYRIIYQVLEKENLVIINYIRHRKDAYKDL